MTSQSPSNHLRQGGTLSQHVIRSLQRVCSCSMRVAPLADADPAWIDYRHGRKASCPSRRVREEDLLVAMEGEQHTILRCVLPRGERRVVEDAMDLGSRLPSTSRQQGARCPCSQLSHRPDQFFFEFCSALQSSRGAIFRRRARDLMTRDPALKWSDNAASCG